MGEIERDRDARRVCRTEPLARYPGVWPQPDAPLFELVMERVEAILEPGAFDPDPQTAEAALEQLLIRQRFPSEFPAPHAASERDDNSASGWCHGMFPATTAAWSGVGPDVPFSGPRRLRAGSGPRSFLPCQRLCDLARAIHKKLRHGAERAFLQGDDCRRSDRSRQVDGQRPERGILPGKPRDAGRRHRHKPARRKHGAAHRKGSGDDGARNVEPPGTKCLEDHAAEQTIRRRQRPRLLDQIGKFNLAPARKRIRCARKNDVRLVKENLRIHVIFGEWSERYAR